MARQRFAARLLALLLVVSADALAQGQAGKVVVLEFDGDARGAVRTQVIEALNDAHQVEVVPLRNWEDAADQRRIAPPAYTQAATLTALGPGLGLKVVIAGEVAERFTVRIFDLNGEPVWTKELPLTRGKLSADNARRLAAAIAAASTAAVATTTPSDDPKRTDGDPDPGATTSRPPDKAPPPVDPPAPPVAEPPLPIRPPLFSGRIAVTTTWRSYCSRPGVNACRQWDDLPDGTEPSGETVTFTTSVPYAGYELAAELFPLAGANGWWNGFGLMGSWAQAFSLTTIQISTPNSTTPPRTVTSLDLAWSAAATYRLYFPMFGLPGYVGLHAGYRMRNFIVEPGTLLKGTQRQNPLFGLSTRLPLAKLAQVELSGAYFLNPRPGPEELSTYGTSARGFGFTAGGGLTGHVWGPLGYALRVSYEGYWHEFLGAGTSWTNGGVSQENYLVLSYGLTAAW